MAAAPGATERDGLGEGDFARLYQRVTVADAQLASDLLGCQQRPKETRKFGAAKDGARKLPAWSQISAVSHRRQHRPPARPVAADWRLPTAIRRVFLKPLSIASTS